MKHPFWKKIHLYFAVFSAIFLVMLSVTGGILAVNNIIVHSHPYSPEKLEDITVSEVIKVIKPQYSEITEINKDAYNFITLNGIDNDNEEVEAYINPKTGEVLGEVLKKSDFVKEVESLHRSLFLHKSGRFIVGVIAVFLFIVGISGLVLLINQGNGLLRGLFSKVPKSFASQYWHILLGRWLFIPLLIVAGTGSILFLQRFGVIDNPPIKEKEIETQAEVEKVLEWEALPVFQEMKLSEVEKIVFPFDENDADEFFVATFKDKELTINQLTGEIVSEHVFHSGNLLHRLSFDLHTGNFSAWWSLFLLLICIGILVFIYTGFEIFIRRSKTVKNKFASNEATHIILYGSENGTTIHFAEKIHLQFINIGIKSFIAPMNDYQPFEKATHLIILTSTYGDGDAPTLANKFLSLLKQHKQNNKLKYSIVGFGSKKYEHYCKFALDVKKALEQEEWAEELCHTHLINQRSSQEFAQWVEEWNNINGTTLNTTANYYDIKKPKLNTFTVIGNTKTTEDDSTFVLTFSTNAQYNSGDLLVVYPMNDQRLRYYSIGKVDKKIHLVVKLYPSGFGSQYLHNLNVGDKIKACVQKSDFYFPKKAKKVIMISNGTGIAPFLGMIQNNKGKTPVKLYCGFRHKTEKHTYFNKIISQYANVEYAYSREGNNQRVSDLVHRDAKIIIQDLKEGAYLMICGAVAMQKDVEKILNNALLNQGELLETYRNQILTDCY